MPKPGTAYARRRARIGRRFALVVTVLHQTGGALLDELPAVAAAEGLTVDEYLERCQDKPLPPQALPIAGIDAELQLMGVGLRRKKGRPAKPVNSNDPIVELLRKHRPNDFKARFNALRAEDTRLWLERRKVYKSVEAITKLVNRAKRSMPK